MQRQPQQSEPQLLTSSYFALQATWGVTKHFGRIESPDALAALCQTQRDSYVLDVGCGTGMPPCYLAQTIGCHVVGIDIAKHMIAWSTRRARHGRLDGRVTCCVADAQHLPFADGTFDVVIGESVTAFIADKPQAMREYARVVRTDGHVGLAKGAWIVPPPADLAAYLARVMAGADVLTPAGWSNLLACAGLTERVAQCATINARRQWKSKCRRMDRDDLPEKRRAWKTFGALLVTSALFRHSLRGLWPPRSVLRMFDYLGSGRFVGRKSATVTPARMEEYHATPDPGVAPAAARAPHEHPARGARCAAHMAQRRA